MRVALLLLCLPAAAVAQNLGYDVQIPHKAASHSYTESYRFSLKPAPGKYRLAVDTEMSVHGARETFTRISDRFAVDVAPARGDWLLARVRAMPLERLRRRLPRAASARAISGWISLDGDHNYAVNAPRTQPELVELRALLETFASKEGARATRHFRDRETIEGERHAPRPFTFAALLRDARQYDGMRVRLTGYRIKEDYLGPAANAPRGSSVWVGRASVFADPKRVAWTPDQFVTIDGFFHRYRGEDSSVRLGVLTLVTRIAPVNHPAH